MKINFFLIILFKLLLRLLFKLLFIFRINNNKIFFMSFDGTSYGFDSKAFVKFLKNKSANSFQIYWGTKDVSLEGYDGSDNLTLVKIKSPIGVFHMMTSRVVIYNINPPSYVPFRKNQILVNTWHGNPIKKVGKYAPNFSQSLINETTCFLSLSEWYTKNVIRDSFNYQGNILNAGSLRNDVFFADNKELLHNLRKKMSLEDKKVILYAPTFRGGFQSNDMTIDIQRLIDCLKFKFGGEWIFLYRLHPMIKKSDKLQYVSHLCKDVSNYPDMQDLLLIADVLVTDYSSSMWDFSLQQKTVLLYVNDIDSYKSERGFYYSPYDLPYPLSRNNDELIDLILKFDKNVYIERLRAFFNKMGCYEKGKACEELFSFLIPYINFKKNR